MTMWRPLMRSMASWSLTSHEQAVSNARAASVECSRGRVEREDVAAYLELHRQPRAGAARERRVWIAHSG